MTHVAGPFVDVLHITVEAYRLMYITGSGLTRSLRRACEGKADVRHCSYCSHSLRHALKPDR